MKKNYIIIGSSAAGIGCLTTIARLESDANILCVTRDSQLPYNTCFLVSYLDDSKQKDQLFLLNENYIKNPNIRFILNTSVIKIVPHEKVVFLSDNQQLKYDKLLLSLGVQPKSIAEVNNDRGLFNFHTFNDTQVIKNYIEKFKIKKAIIVGSGLTGLECADALWKKNIDVSIVESKDLILPAFLDNHSSNWLKNKLEQNRINIFLNDIVCDYEYTNERISSVTLANGRKLDADIVIFSIGVRPIVNLAKEAGIDVNDGIITNNFLETNISDVFAAGDCTELVCSVTQEKIRSTTWPEAFSQGIVAGHNMVGLQKTYKQPLKNIHSVICETKLIFCGMLKNINGNLERVINKNEHYYQEVFIDDNIIKGFVLLGNCEEAAAKLKKALVLQQLYSEFKQL